MCSSPAAVNAEGACCASPLLSPAIEVVPRGQAPSGQALAISPLTAAAQLGATLSVTRERFRT